VIAPANPATTFKETERNCHINSMGARDPLDDLYDNLV
jgi:hypothetical protein